MSSDKERQDRLAMNSAPIGGQDRLEELFREQGEWAQRAQKATGAATGAYERLLKIAETDVGGQAGRVARILAGLFNGTVFPIDPYDLRPLDVEISDDILTCLDALRWAKQDVHTLVPHGEERTLAVLKLWGIEWPPE